MSLIGVRMTVGDRVRVREEGRHLRVNTNQRLEVFPTEELMVTRVYRESLMVRTVRLREVTDGYTGMQVFREISFTINRERLELWDPNAPRPAPERRLGQKPEDTEEQTFLGVDDPRIAWIWADLGKYADGKNWCAEYDALCARVGIPGRPRDFTVRLRIGGMDFTTTVKASSQADANRIAREAAGLQTGEPEPPATPGPDFALAG